MPIGRVNEARWILTEKPKDSLDLWYTRLAEGTQGRFAWELLLASNGKLFRVFTVKSTGQELKWEGYEG